MEGYELRFQPSVEKDLRPLPREIVARVMARINALRNDPFPSGAIKLTGSARHFRIRVGDYRIILTWTHPPNASRSIMSATARSRTAGFEPKPQSMDGLPDDGLVKNPRTKTLKRC